MDAWQNFFSPGQVPMIKINSISGMCVCVCVCASTKFKCCMYTNVSVAEEGPRAETSCYCVMSNCVYLLIFDINDTV